MKRVNKSVDELCVNRNSCICSKQLRNSQISQTRRDVKSRRDVASLAEKDRGEDVVDSFIGKNKNRFKSDL